MKTKEKKEIKKIIKKMIKNGGTTHYCEDKKCRCYNPKAEDENCYVVYKEDVKELLKALEEK